MTNKLRLRLFDHERYVHFSIRPCISM